MSCYLLSLYVLKLHKFHGKQPNMDISNHYSGCVWLKNMDGIMLGRRVTT